MIIASADWTLVLAAAVSAVPATLAAIFSALNRRDIKLPSGGKIGEKVEKAHELAAVAVAQNMRLINGEAEPPHGTNSETGGTKHGTEAGPENH